MTIAPARPCARCARDSVTVHARGLCSYCYARHRDEFPRVKFHRPYTAGERALIRRDWGRRPAKAIAAELGRKVRDVYAAAVRFGAAEKRRQPRPGEGPRAEALRRHARGLSDREIAAEIGVGHNTVSRWLRRAGLPSNCRTRNTDPFPPRYRGKMRRLALLRIRRLGPEDACGFLRPHAAGRAKAVRMGWPQADTFREARVLDTLHGTRGLTLAALAAATGLRPTWLGTVTRGLKRRGLVAVAGRRGRECVYALAAGVARGFVREGGV